MIYVALLLKLVESALWLVFGRAWFSCLCCLRCADCWFNFAAR